MNDQDMAVLSRIIGDGMQTWDMSLQDQSLERLKEHITKAIDFQDQSLKLHKNIWRLTGGTGRVP